ncbi:MAG: hypothetical protein WBG08_06850 [Litorimonas sp.]
MASAALLAVTALATPGLAPDVHAQSSVKKDAHTRIAERDLRELKRLLPGIYTNEEQVYFQTNLDLPEDQHVPRVELVMERAGEAFESVLTYSDGRQLVARHDFRVEGGVIRAVALRDGRAECERTTTREFESYHGKGCEGPFVVTPDGIMLDYGGPRIDLLRARTFNCWASPRKEDGTYAFYNDLVLHDQGGRLWIEATDSHPRVGLKMRNVRWPTGINRDSLVLYTYQGEDEDYAPAYTWTDPDAERIAINTRWLQASCTAGDAAYKPNINLRTGAGSGQ